MKKSTTENLSKGRFEGRRLGALGLSICLLAAASLAGCSGKTGGQPGSFGEGRTETAQTSGAGAAQTAEPEADGSAGQTKDKGTITVTYVQAPLNVPSIVEMDQGILARVFGEQGYETAYSNLTTGPEQTQALASGDIQFLNAVGATSVILSAANGADIKIISMYSRSPKAFKLFARDETIRSPEDLRGKKVAGPKGTILHELLIAYLAGAGMTEDDIEFTAMGIPDSQAALAGGSVDAALLAGPTAYNMEKDGYPVVTDGEGLTEASIVTATSGKFFEEHPEVVHAFAEGQKQVLDYMAANEEAALAAAAEATELSPEAVKEMYGMYDFNWEIADKDIAAMEKTKEFMLKTGMIETDVEIKDLILDKDTENSN